MSFNDTLQDVISRDDREAALNLAWGATSAAEWQEARRLLRLDSEREAMNIWMYYETDGDSGYYGVRLFATEATAQRYREKQRGNAYGNIKSMEVWP